MSDYERLIGEDIQAFKLKKDGSQLTLYFNGKRSAVLVPEGDCCSYTWIESIDNEDALNGKILSVEDIEMPDLGNIDGKRYEGVDEVQYYGLKIVTENGDCVIDYRNSSNGCYGGTIVVRYL